MNLYFKIGWLSLIFLFLITIVIGSIFHLTLDTNIIIIFVLIALPLINILIREVKKDFFHLPFSLNAETFIKGGVLIFYVIIGNTYDFTIMNSFIGFYGLFSFLFVFESRISFLIALLCLVFCPVLLITENQTFAETFAIIAYYFLCIGVFTQIREFTFHKNESYDA